MHQLDRRTFLKLGGVGLLGVAFTPILGGCEGNPADPDLTLTGFTPFITPNDQFYIQHGGRDTIAGWTMPSLTKANWQLEITGEVAEELTLTWSDIETAIDAGHERIFLKTMRCVLDSHLRPGATGWTGNAYWHGVPLRVFLDRAGLFSDSAKRLVFTGYDSFSNNITLERYGTSDQGVMEPMLVYKMNDTFLHELGAEHGGPVRLMLLESYGYKCVKWLRRVNASLFNTNAGTYQREGFTDDGIIRVASRSENIGGSISVPTGLVEIAGYAVSGYAAIDKVEISVDDGPYQAATITPFQELLGSVPRPDGIMQLADLAVKSHRGVWTKWHFKWNAPAGSHTVAIRATDAEGNVQPEDDFEITDGQTGIIRYNVTVS